MPLLEARSLTKSFPGVRALKGVSLTVERGEVLAVIGENGAGKSTLMKILAGVQTADSGEILLDGQPVALRSVHDALASGIALIHQELNLADNLDVAANIFLGREPLIAPCREILRALPTRSPARASCGRHRATSRGRSREKTTTASLRHLASRTRSAGVRTPRRSRGGNAE